MAVYMHIDGVKGDVSTKEYNDWILLDSFRVLAKCNVNHDIGRFGQREVGRPRFSNAQIVKFTDTSSPDIFTHFCGGKTFDEVKIDVCHAEKDLKPHVQYILSNVVISHIDDVASSERSDSSETMLMSFTKIEKRYTPVDSQGKAKAPCSSGYDLEKASVI